MRYFILSGVIAALTITAPAEAKVIHHNYSKKVRQENRQLRKKVIQLSGDKNAAGRDIITLGRRPGKDATVSEYFATLRRMAHPQPVVISAPVAVDSAPTNSSASEAVLPTNGSTVTSSTSTAGSANPYVNPQCESGGNPQAVDPSGTYWGKYQFDRSTWIASGGNPSDYGHAGEAEQDQVASHVHYDAWPNC